MTSIGPAQEQLERQVISQDRLSKAFSKPLAQLEVAQTKALVIQLAQNQRRPKHG